MDGKPDRTDGPTAASTPLISTRIELDQLRPWYPPELLTPAQSSSLPAYTFHYSGPNDRQDVPIMIDTDEADGFTIDGLYYPLPSLELAYVEQSPGTMRMAGPVPAIMHGRLLVFFALEGSAAFAVGDGRVRLESGQAGLYPVDVPMEGFYETTLRTAVVCLTKDLLAANGVEWPKKFTVFSGSSLIEPAKQLTTALLSTRGGLSAEAAGPASQALLHLVIGLLLENQRAANVVNSDTSLHRQALDLIAAHFTDRSLDSAVIAARLHVSARTLQRAFSEQGVTVSQTIRAQRLSLAIHLLTTPEFGELTIATIGERSGFSSPDDLRRALHDQFGMSPRQFRTQSVPKQGRAEPA